MAASEFNFHGDDEFFTRGTENVLLRALNKKICSESDIKIIRTYLDESSGQNRIGLSRKKKMAIAFTKNRMFFDKDYVDCTYEDLLTAIERLKVARKKDGSPMYAKSIITERVWAMKHLFLWMIDNGYIQMDARKVMQIKLPKHPITTVTSEELPSVEEVCRIISCTTNPRDRCLFSFLYDGGLRFGDACGIRFRDLRLTDNCIIVQTSYKTGRNRTIPLYNCVDVFKEWMKVYPAPHTPDDFVFCYLNDKTKCLTYRGARKNFDTACIRAGLGNKFTPHKFRHARITELLREGMTEQTVKMLAWGGESKAIQIYNHLCGTDVEREMARIQGFDFKDKSQQTDTLRCSVCGAPVTPLDRFCPTCYAMLDTTSNRTLRRRSTSNWADTLHEIEAENMGFCDMRELH